MNNKNFEVYFDCGASKVRAIALNKDNLKSYFYEESNFFSNDVNTEIEIQKMILSLESSTKEYLNDVNLIIDSPEMLSISISISKKLDGSKIKEKDIQFLIQDAKQQVLANHKNKNIIHIIIKNYKIDDVKYTFLPNDINCNLISLDILFICLPKEIVEQFKKIFLRLDISVNQIFCSSYVKSMNYKDNFSLIENISFVDIGFNKTSITCYNKNEIIFLDVLPIGGNHITKDISKVLKVDLLEAENLKLSFVKSEEILKEKKTFPLLIQKIIFARIEEILELSAKSIELNLVNLKHFKIVLMGDGSKILNNRFKENISLLNDIDLIEETSENSYQSVLKLARGLNKQEVVIVPKKSIKQGFFESLFLFFK
jgi:cell division protein FtsA